MDTVAYNFKNMERVNQSSYPKSVYALMIILMMAGNVYLFPFYRSLDMGEILLFICLPYFLAKLSQKTVQRQDGIIFLFLWYAIIISFAMNSVLGGSLMSPIIRLSRDFFYYFIIFFLGIHFFDFKIFKKMLVAFLFDIKCLCYLTGCSLCTIRVFYSRIFNEYLCE